MTAQYDAAFYSSSNTDLGRSSAAAVAALVHEYLQPLSVVDFGCGNGAWTKAFADRGATEYLGLDGPWVDPQWLDIPADHFREADLAAGVTLERSFDLAISLEVAEHLPPESAEPFVAGLTAAAPVVLFSAAIPFQGGTGHHNEQWPSYWRERFAGHGFVPVDALRPRIWEREDIAYYYRQNIMFFVREASLSSYAELAQAHRRLEGRALDLVHPHAWQRRSGKPVNFDALLGRQRADRLRGVADDVRGRLRTRG